MLNVQLKRREMIPTGGSKDNEGFVISVPLKRFENRSLPDKESKSCREGEINAKHFRSRYRP
jgi:hypothetical protein